MRGSSPAPTSEQDSFGRGFREGVLPLSPVALIALVALILAAMSRQVTAGQEFATQQVAAVLIVALGLLGCAIAYIACCWRVLRRVRYWHETGENARANGALWGLVLVALVIVLPLLLAILIPQYPAPTLTH